jgi:hypothetical protein
MDQQTSFNWPKAEVSLTRLKAEVNLGKAQS